MAYAGVYVIGCHGFESLAGGNSLCAVARVVAISSRSLQSMNEGAIYIQLVLNPTRSDFLAVGIGTSWHRFCYWTILV